MFFEKPTPVRLTKEQKKTIQKIVYDNPEVYFNISHFIRVAIIKQLNKYKR